MQVSAKVTVKSNNREVQKAMAQANFRNLGQASATIRRSAQASIKVRKKASAPGSPPNSRKKALPKAILYAVDKQRQKAIIGVSADLLRTVGQPHEHGGEFREAKYPQRPFMGPSLTKNLRRIPGYWRYSLAPVRAGNTGDIQ